MFPLQLDDQGRYTGNFKTYAFCGPLRVKVRCSDLAVFALLCLFIKAVLYGGPQVQNTTQTYKTQHRHTKHNTDMQNTIQICKTQDKYMKHNIQSSLPAGYQPSLLLFQ